MTFPLSPRGIFYRGVSVVKRGDAETILKQVLAWQGKTCPELGSGDCRTKGLPA